MRYYLVIKIANGEPMAIRAANRESIKECLGNVALIAATTKEELLRAGWSADDITDPEDAQ